jgi:hypothetical protein
MPPEQEGPQPQGDDLGIEVTPESVRFCVRIRQRGVH